MADIVINDNKLVKGKLSVSRTLDTSQLPNKVIIQGQLSTHKYIEEINTIETDRLYLADVLITQEAFGSDDFNILYSFTAEELVVKGGESHLGTKEIEIMENKIYEVEEA